MKKIIKYGIGLSILYASILSVFSIATLHGDATEAVPELAGETALQDTYFTGAEIAVPSVNIQYGTQIEEASVVVHYPNNKSYSSDKYVLNEPGAYTIEYKATFDGVVQSVFETFNVYDPAYVVASDRAEIYYGQNEGDRTAYGLNAVLSKNEVFRYAYPVDLNDFDKETSVVSIRVIPSVVGDYDFTELYVRFVDVYDETNYVTTKIHNNRRAYEGLSWYLVGASNQPLKGRDWTRGDKQIFSGDFGMVAGSSLNGVKPAGYGENNLDIYWDYEEKQVFGTTYMPKPVNNMVADLDSLEYYTDIWEGFTTGEVFVEIWTDQNVNTGNLSILKIGDHDLSNEYLDESKILPSVEINQDTSTIPVGVVGMPYKLFDATAEDLFTENVVLTKKVYKNYGTSSQVEIDSVNGYFIPNSTGIYTIEYVATNRALGKTVKTLNVQVNATANELKLGAVTPSETSGTVGLPVSLADYSVEKFGSGKTNVVVSVKHVSTEKTYEVFDKKGKYSFVPLQTGAYEVTYTLTDYVEQVDTQTYVLNVTLNDGAIIDEKPSLPNYFIVGEKYILPLHYAKIYAQDGSYTEVACDITVIDADGERKLDANREYIPASSLDITSATVVYQAGENGIPYTQTVELLNTRDHEGELNLSAYFKTENGMTSSLDRENKKNIVFTAERDGASTTFINRLLAGNFSVRFAPMVGGDIQQIDVTLTDVNDEEKRSVFSFFYYAANEEKCEFCVNDGRRYVLNTPFLNLTTNDYLYLEYSSTLSTVTVNNDKLNLLLEDDPLADSTEVYLSITVNGLSKESGLWIDRICGQMFSGATTVDRFAPDITLDGEMPKRVVVGSEIELVTARALDVLSPTAELTVSVYDPQNNLVVDMLSGELIKNSDPSVIYKISCAQLGEYFVQYAVKDSSGKSAQWFYTVVAYENQPPVITLEKEIVTNANVGDFIEVSKISVTENATTYVCITLPNATTLTLDTDKYNGFIAENAGTYLVTYMAWDEAGNYAIETYRITVK